MCHEMEQIYSEGMESGELKNVCSEVNKNDIIVGKSVFDLPIYKVKVRNF